MDKIYIHFVSFFRSFSLHCGSFFPFMRITFDHVLLLRSRQSFVIPAFVIGNSFQYTVYCDKCLHVFISSCRCCVQLLLMLYMCEHQIYLIQNEQEKLRFGGWLVQSNRDCQGVNTRIFDLNNMDIFYCISLKRVSVDFHIETFHQKNVRKK